MTLWQMSVSGAVLIAVIVLLRALTLWRLPKRTFVFLWGMAALRLMLPFAVSSAYSVWSLWQDSAMVQAQTPANPAEALADIDAAAANGAGRQSAAGKDNVTGKENAADNENAAGKGNHAEKTGETLTGGPGATGRLSSTRAPGSTGRADSTHMPGSTDGPASTGGPGTASGPSVRRQLLWGAVSGLGVLFFAIVYLRECREFAMALPMENAAVQKWRETHPLRRPLRIRQSDRVRTPLTYGILRPVILLPKELNGAEEQTLLCVLEHEFVHVRRFDSLAKLLMTFVLCVHWFNPMVWAMYQLFNRDLELACDEAVLDALGEKRRRDYALTLINMEELKNGLIPLANGFSQNAMEERITAVMKRKRISWKAFAITVLLAAGAFWACSTMPEPKRVQAAPSEIDLTQQEWEQIEALRPDGYRGLTIRDYQKQVWALTDTAAYRELLERLESDEELYEKRDENETAAFLFYILMPLTGDRWAIREYGSYATVSFEEGIQVTATRETENGEPIRTWTSGETAVLEYFVQLTITDRDKLTVGQYDETRQKAEEELQAFFFARSKEELEDVEKMETLLTEKAGQIAKAESRDGLEVELSYYYVPLTPAPEADLQIWKQQNQEQRDAWPEDKERENRSYPHATEEDYRSLFSEMMTEGWQEETLAQFNERLLDWCNRHPEAMERIGTDAFYDDYAVSLSEEERYFTAVSFDLSRSENALWVESLKNGTPQKDPEIGIGPWLSKERADGSWCQLRYCFSYHVQEPELVTVEERDRTVCDMRERIETFWEQSSLENLLRQSEEEIADLFREYAAACGTERVSIEIEREDVRFQSDAGR